MNKNQKRHTNHKNHTRSKLGEESSGLYYSIQKMHKICWLIFKIPW